MSNLKSILVMFIACPFLTGCALIALFFTSSPRTAVDESWTQKPSKVNIVFSEPVLDNPNKFDDDFPDFAGKFNDWFIAELKSNLESQTSDIHYSMQKISKDKIKIEPALFKDENINVPKVTEMDKSADVYLVIDSIWVGGTSKETTCDVKGMEVPCDKHYLTAKGNFAYYDTKNGKRLGYGKIESNSTFRGMVTPGNWTGMINLTANKVLMGTPLEK